MEENKFEKQVQQKMDELRIHPSDSVWKRIEVSIEKKKSPNRGLFLLVLLFFVFLAGGYLLWNTVQHSVKEVSNSEKINSEKNNEISIKEDKDTQAKTNVTPGSINQKNNKVGNTTLMKNTNKNSSQHYNLSAAKRIIKINSGEKATIVLSKQQEVNDEVSENADTKPSIVQPAEIQSENEKIKAEIKDSAYDILNTDSLSKPPSLHDEKAKVKDTLKQILTSPETAKHSKKNKWKPGILISAGISGVGNNFLGLVNSAPYDYLNSPAAGQGTGPRASAWPSGTRSAFGFMAGVFAERNVSAKIKLVTGINFKSFNTSNKVGIRNDTTRFYNSQNSINTYKNHYNFIELPVTLKIQIGRGKNIPLFWQGGLVVSELVSSNALQFNPVSGLYYTNNSIFNKTQIGLNTSISAALLSNQKNSVLIGPYFYYGASRLANEGLYNKKHFVFTGLRTEIIFGK
jgi:hypothetical protein